jgi:hypothetical protein
MDTEIALHNGITIYPDVQQTFRGVGLTRLIQKLIQELFVELSGRTQRDNLNPSHGDPSLVFSFSLANIVPKK